jgi:hypothetical protein
MQNIRVGSALVRFGAGAGIFFVWTVFEKQVIGPFGIHQYMPFYRVNGMCAWDILAITVIFAAFVRSETQSGREII